MGNQASLATNSAASTTATATAATSSFSVNGSPPAASSAAAQQIAELIYYAQTNYETNPTDSLLSLLQALKMNSGQASADQAMERIRAELGSDIAEHVMDRQGRLQRAMDTVQALVADESSVLHQQGNQHLLQQAMEDGSSVVCAKCNAVIPATRWQPHQEFWCEAIDDDDTTAEGKDN